MFILLLKFYCIVSGMLWIMLGVFVYLLRIGRLQVLGRQESKKRRTKK